MSTRRLLKSIVQTIIPIVADKLFGVDEKKRFELIKKHTEDIFKTQSEMYSKQLQLMSEASSSQHIQEEGEKRVSVEYCVTCAVKHLLNAKTFLIEGLPRRGKDRVKKFRDAFRELSAAEEHLVEGNIEIASEIRKLRKKLEPCIYTDKCNVVSPSEIDEIIDKITSVVPESKIVEYLSSLG